MKKIMFSLLGLMLLVNPMWADEGGDCSSVAGAEILDQVCDEYFRPYACRDLLGANIWAASCLFKTGSSACEDIEAHSYCHQVPGESSERCGILLEDVGAATKITQYYIDVFTDAQKGVQCSFSGEKPDVSYVCSQGYYGTARDESGDDCVTCPQNATCAGGNNSTFKCDDGFCRVTAQSKCVKKTANMQCNANDFSCLGGTYKSGDDCVTCPQNADCSSGTPICNVGFYGLTNNGTCEPCPTNVLASNLKDSAKPTSAKGTNNITGCYIGNGVKFEDASGAGEFTADTYYCN